MVELIIDPGHGGKDPGGGSNQYWKEKDMVLDISLYQYKRFKELGVPVALTRDKDVYLSPSERTRIVRNSGAKHSISNHINAGGGDGVETIHSIFADDELARQLALEITKEGQNLRRVFSRTLPYNSKKDYYYMHRDTGSVNTTIIEYGFADSKKDDVQQLLKHWKDYAEAVIRAYCNFIGHNYTLPKQGVQKLADSPIEKVWKVVKVVSDKYGIYGRPVEGWKEESEKYLNWTFVVRNQQVVKGKLWYELTLNGKVYGWIAAHQTEERSFRWAYVKEDTKGFLHSDLKTVFGAVEKGSKIAILDESDDKFLIVHRNQPQWVQKKIVEF